MLGVVVHTYNPSTQEANAGGMYVHGQLQLHMRPCLTKTPPPPSSRKEAQGRVGRQSSRPPHELSENDFRA
jgi:hypothetical protein